MDFQRSVRQLPHPVEESRPRLPDRRRIATHPSKEDAVRTAGTSTRRIYLFVLHGIGIHRRAKSDQGKHPHLVRRQTMDHDAPAQDADTGKYTAIESTSNAFGEIRRNAARRSSAACAEQSETQLVSERNCRPVRHREEHYLPHRKT